MQQTFRAIIVQLVLKEKTEEALGLFTQQYAMDASKIRASLPEDRKKKALGHCSAEARIIWVLKSDALREQFVVLHKSCHHSKANPGSSLKELKSTRTFLPEFIQAYKSTPTKETEND